MDYHIQHPIGVIKWIVMNDDQLQRLYSFLTEKFDAIDRRFETIEARLDAFDKRFDAIEARLDAIEMRLDEMDERIEAIEKRVDEMDARLETFKSRVYAQFKENELKQNEILDLIGEDNTAIDKFIRNHEKRIIKLEGSV